MRALLIDPETRTVSEVQVNPDLAEHTVNDTEICALLGCEDFGRVMKIDDHDSVYADEYEGEGHDDPRYYFEVQPRQGLAWEPIGRKGLVFGPRGEDAKISVDELTSRVTFDSKDWFEREAKRRQAEADAKKKKEAAERRAAINTIHRWSVEMQLAGHAAQGSAGVRFDFASPFARPISELREPSAGGWFRAMISVR